MALYDGVFVMDTQANAAGIGKGSLRPCACRFTTPFSSAASSASISASVSASSAPVVVSWDSVTCRPIAPEKPVLISSIIWNRS